MQKLKKVRKRLLILILILAAFIFLNNSSLLAKPNKEEPLLLAHRGLAQTFPMEGIEWDTCTAERIFEPAHPYLENTIPSMEAAFKAGADVVELDIHPTIDGEWAVFHDWTLECRTNGEGVTREHTMGELKQLDIGYGYSADNGKSFPFRGKGIGLMPTLTEVLERFPEEAFLLHIKSNDQEEGRLLADYLSELPKERLQLLSVYGGNEPIASLAEKLPHVRVMSMDTLKSCLIPYELIGWTGYVPDSCKETQVHIPEKYAKILWGWPNKFLSRMEEVNTRVILVAGDGGWSEGFDSETDLERLPSHYSGGIWTNRIDRVAPILQE
ncbi:glycerophosphodiester phosphodiesterase family protein [Niallia endozanthoxylica]|uniref:Glycerophosphodiester phosphodiesterase n=1 Tax=Niallia endozanthoxylica TaxID=2036016 RepID=A0A5J5HQR0_9BACI|nr:glycerophosphodiester phosphodiesterase family protein [Niallia endozanthoxylica]KAA9021777.1 glycerophosphodiester phosphodiesterase [Niallia endozanthoxylica]